MITTTQIDSQDSNTIYLILDGNKTVDKASFLNEIGALLKFPNYYGKNWDALDECLGDIISIWESSNPSYITPISGVDSALSPDLKVNVIWLDPFNFSKYNKGDFLIALDILKGITEDETNPLTFVLATNIINVNTDSFK
jgi:hypothetical protein